VALAVGRGLRLDVALERHARGLEARDRAFVHELVYGVARLRGRLDHLLARRVRGGLERLEPPVLVLLRLGAYQILYMDSVPGYAAVSESVEAARRHAGKGAGGLVNAVLRGVAQDGDGVELFPPFETDPAGFLGTWGSHPRWLVDRWLSRWSPSEVRGLTEADNRRPGIYLVPLRHTPDEAARLLAEAGVEATPAGEGLLALRLAEDAGPAAALGVLPALIQDPAQRPVGIVRQQQEQAGGEGAAVTATAAAATAERAVHGAAAEEATM
jgi:16S rRNA (cytosine967-C5)-methyltransferase